MNDSLNRLTNVLMILVTLFSSLIDITIIRIYIKQKLLKDGFFHVIFGQIMMELLVNIALFFLNAIYLFSGSVNAGKWIFIFPILFNFGFISNIIYNIRIIFFLMTFNKDREELINYASRNQSADESRRSITRTGSLLLKGMSFKNFHVISYVIATIHTIFYIVNLASFQEVEIQGENWHWYFYFICGQKHFGRIFFFIFHILYFIISVPYIYFSCDKNKLSNHIYLRSYSIFCFFSSIIALFIPIVLFIFMWGFNDNAESFNSNYLILMSLGFLVFLVGSAIFRMNCYYVNYILVQDGKGCLKRWSNAIKILFCLKSMQKLNFVDLNSAYIYHALASASDFILDDVTEVNEMAMFENEKIEIKEQID